MKRIRKDDEVIVLAGRNKGKRGFVEKSLGDYVIVKDVNVVKKTVRPNPMTGAVGGIIDKPMPIHVSNVSLFDVTTNKAARVGFKVVNGRKVRVFKPSGRVVGEK
jgi:large subunit ribosomal protein L24